MNARQDAAWKNLSFYRGYLPPTDRERVKEYILLALPEEVVPSLTPRGGSKQRENSGDPALGSKSNSAYGIPSISPPMSSSSQPNSPPTVLEVSASVPQSSTPQHNHQQQGSFKVEGFDYFPPAPPPPPRGLPPALSATAFSPAFPAPGGLPLPTPMDKQHHTTKKAFEYKRFFVVKKSALTQIPHFKSFLFKVKKCLDICTNPLPCVPDCPSVHVEIDNPDLTELTFDGTESIIVNRGNQLPSASVKVCDMERTAGALFCCGLMSLQITQAVQGTQCRFGEKCRYGSRCLFIHLKSTAVVDDAEQTSIPEITEAETLLQDAVPLLRTEDRFLEYLREMGIETVGDVQIMSNTAFDSIVNRSPPEEMWLWTQIHSIREIKERETPLVFALATFPGIPTERIAHALETYRLESVNQLLELKPKQFYALKLPPKIADACERIRLRYEPEREAYSTIDLVRLPETSFFRRMATLVLQFRFSNAHKSWRKQDATRPIVTSLITYVDSSACSCTVYSNTSNLQTPAIGFQRQSSVQPQQQPREGSGSPLSTKSPFGDTSPETSWCRCPRKYELAVNYELSTPSGSRCSEQNCLGKLASMGLATASIREVFVHGDTHNNEDPNPLFPCGVCENMFRRVTHDVQKQYGGDVTLYMFDTVRNPRKLVCIPVQEISHREGANFKRFIQEDLRGSDDPFNNSIT